MKKVVLMPVMALVVLLMITPVMARATKFPAWGTFLGSAIVPPIPELWTSEEGVLQLRGAIGRGTFSGNILSGIMEFTLNAAIDVNPESSTFGEGTMHGKWVFSDDYGTFEGSWRTENWGGVYEPYGWMPGIYMEGGAVALGTGAYEGMVMTGSFWGYNLYVGGLPLSVPDGVYFDYEGAIVSPQGVPLPP